MPERKIDRAVEALFSGARMLSIHCAECRGPLFEKEGRVFCPTCGERKVGKEAPEEGLEGTLRKKLEELKARLETEKDHEQMMRTLKEIDALVEVLKKLRST
ncbi:MAG: Sjogren's syndrome/scleroderma autoantigen 1 family protein [Candidatus Hadarchaeales archaeon]